MLLRIAGIVCCLSLSEILYSDTLEDRLGTVHSLFTPQIMDVNPAAVSCEKTVVAGLRLLKTSESSYEANPAGNNSGNVSYKANLKDVAMAMQLPLGGAAFGLGATEHSREIKGKLSTRNGEIAEEFWTREYKMKFVIDLTSELRAGFGFQYHRLESDLLGSFNLANTDRTRYKGTLSGYSLGLVYNTGPLAIGAVTAPPMRGKATVEGEQKIIADPGLGVLTVSYKPSDRWAIGLVAKRWFYKHDERDDAATSPEDQRDILLRGIELEQFLRKTQALGLNAEYMITPIVGLKLGLAKSDAVFLFDSSKVPGDSKASETKLSYTETQLGAFIRNKQFFGGLFVIRAARKKDSIASNRDDVGLRTIGSYDSKESGNLLVIGASL